jgi:hypothetical protein
MVTTKNGSAAGPLRIRNTHWRKKMSSKDDNKRIRGGSAIRIDEKKYHPKTGSAADPQCALTKNKVIHRRRKMDPRRVRCGSAKRSHFQEKFSSRCKCHPYDPHVSYKNRGPGGLQADPRNTLCEFATNPWRIQTFQRDQNYELVRCLVKL